MNNGVRGSRFVSIQKEEEQVTTNKLLERSEKNKQESIGKRGVSPRECGLEIVRNNELNRNK